MKVCARYKKSDCASGINPQPLENFSKDKNRKDGLTVHCKACFKKFREDTKDQRRKTILAWRKKNPHKMKEYRAKNSVYLAAKTKLWRVNNRDSILRSRYGITAKQYDDMFEKQQGCCAICTTHATHLRKKLHIDHCHRTGKVRGLLCIKCNMAIGLLKDDKRKVLKVCEYLLGEEH